MSEVKIKGSIPALSTIMTSSQFYLLLFLRDKLRYSPATLKNDFFLSCKQIQHLFKVDSDN
jgi:hypothetical protein